VLISFFEASESAFLHSNPLRLKVFLEEKKKGAIKAVKLSKNLDRTLITFWIAITLLEALATAIVFYFAYNIFEKFINVCIITVVVVFLVVLIFGRTIPNQQASQQPEKIVLKNAGVIYFLDKVFFPFSFILLRFRKRIVKESDAPAPKVTEEELESIIDTMETEGVFDEEDAELIQSAIGLNERTVYDIMTPRVDVVAIEEKMGIEEIKNIFFEYQFSRVPVYREDKDNIVGILSEKDFFTALLKNEEINLKKLISKPLFVSESTKVNDLIKEFQKAKKHFAIVVDEYGGTSGIVTMEDALEELVGEIYDEYDDEELEDIVKLAEDHYLVSPEMEVEDFFDYFNIYELPETHYNSIGGFVYGLIGGIPKEGMVANYKVTTLIDEDEYEYDFKFTIKTVLNKRIRQIELEVSKEKLESIDEEDENE